MTTIPCCTRKRRQTCAAVLPCALPMRVEHLVALDAAARDRTVGNDRHAMLAAGRDHLRLIEERMHLDLIADQRFAGRALTASSIIATVKFDMPMWRARPARLTLQSAPSVSLSGMFGFGQCSSRRSTSDRRSLRQAFLGGTFEFARSKMRRPDFRGDENLVALDAARRAAPRPPRARCRTSPRCRYGGSRAAAPARPCARRCARAGPRCRDRQAECARRALRRPASLSYPISAHAAD